ncbi:DUF4097 family beta strand repeat-containing protein [Nonomuraea jiangxiensis]|uniref:Putative adhesin n=1 Tax=Nonomuraea jiangxiensis TaxID=633440 RepID=A0A1G7YDU5_9ACTN|nr:DUF4097 family beta strand repeat-containing protein [Nonomuraea jiangxiensis]SDG94722.1 Putative adhesin [Nonomuraea jiangxiensis]
MKTIAIAGGLLGSALLLSGCGLAVVGGPSEQDTVSYEVTDKVSALRLQNGSGDAVVTETGGSAVRVVETLRWRGDTKPAPQHQVDGDVLRLTYDCPTDWGSCGVDYRIEIPKGLRVDVDAGSGDLTLRGLTGELVARIGSGDLDASGLAGKKVVAETGSGNIELKYTAAPDSVQLRTGSGDLTLNVPDGSYDVKSRVGSGDENVSVKTDASSPHKISVSTGSGDVNVSAG